MPWRRAVVLGAALLAACVPARAPFYSKTQWSGRIRVAAHADVPDEALQAARTKLDEMLRDAPELRANLERNEMELHVIGRRQFPSDLPEHADQRGVFVLPDQLFDGHMRAGGHFVGRFASCTEGALLGYTSEFNFGSNVCGHEIAHAFHDLGFGRAVWDQLDQLYRSAAAAKRWISAHASIGPNEYFAEATQVYFLPDGHFTWVDPKLGRGRGWLRETDPEMFAFVDAIYGGRLSPGRFVDAQVAPLRADTPLRSASGRTRVRVIVRSRLDVPVQLVWMDHDGRRDRRPGSWRRVAPGMTFILGAIAGHVFTVLDAHAEAQCVFAAPDENARVVLERGTCGLGAAEHPGPRSERPIR